jgi:ABC-type methionine transport system permease subunit
MEQQQRIEATRLASSVVSCIALTLRSIPGPLLIAQLTPITRAFMLGLKAS